MYCYIVCQFDFELNLFLSDRCFLFLNQVLSFCPFSTKNLEC